MKTKNIKEAKMNRVDYVIRDVEMWLRISTKGEYLPEEYLDMRELREYLISYAEN